MPNDDGGNHFHCCPTHAPQFSAIVGIVGYNRVLTIHDDFIATACAYRDGRRAAFSQAVARLQQASTSAATTLLKIMLDSSAPPACKVRAAVCVLEQSNKGNSEADTLFP